jgi:hypothetical protein
MYPCTASTRRALEAFCAAQGWETARDGDSLRVVIPHCASEVAAFRVDYARDHFTVAAVETHLARVGVALLLEHLDLPVPAVAFCYPHATLQTYALTGSTFQTLFPFVPFAETIPRGVFRIARDMFQHRPRRALLLLARLMGHTPQLTTIGDLQVSSSAVETPQNARLVLHMVRDMARRNFFTPSDIARWTPWLRRQPSRSARLCLRAFEGEPLPIPEEPDLQVAGASAEMKTDPPPDQEAPLFRGLSTMDPRGCPRQHRAWIEAALDEAEIPFRRFGDWTVRTPTLKCTLASLGRATVVRMWCYDDDEVALTRAWKYYRRRAHRV